MVTWPLPVEAVLWITHRAQPPPARRAWRLLPLLRGMLFARGRLTGARWLRAAGLGADFRRPYPFPGGPGRKAEWVATLRLRRAVAVLVPGERSLFALGDTPTKRYGPQVALQPGGRGDLVPVHVQRLDEGYLNLCIGQLPGPH